MKKRTSLNSFNSLLPLISFLLVSCISEKETKVITINNVAFTVEIADTDSKRQEGLMYREILPYRYGMLFVFTNDEIRRFWMKNTSLALSIAFINAQGVILEIYDMQPYSLETVSSRYPVRYALELSQGSFEQYHIVIGDRIHISD